jgi:hypothetical protein
MRPFRSQCSKACRDEGSDVRYKYSATANALIRQAKRLNMQCGIDCSTVVECNPIMLVLLSDVALRFHLCWWENGKASPPKRTEKFH